MLWRCCGGPFAGDRPSVFQRSPSLLVSGAMRVGAVAGGRRRGRPPDGASCSRHAGLQQCKPFVEMCIVSCLSAAPECVCGRGLQPGAALVVVCLAVVTLPPRSTAPAVAGGCRLVGCSVVSRRPLRSRAVAGVWRRVCVGLGDSKGGSEGRDCEFADPLSTVLVKRWCRGSEAWRRETC